MNNRLDCDDAATMIRRAVTGLPTRAAVVRRALAHVATCARCNARFASAWLPMCHQFEAALPEAAAALRAREALGDRFPALAAHVELCERCEAVLADLVHNPEPSSGTRPVDVRALFERALVVALGDADPMVRRRAAARLGQLSWIGPAAYAALEACAADPDATVRAEAVATLGLAVRAEDVLPGKEAPVYKEQVLREMQRAWRQLGIHIESEVLASVEIEPPPRDRVR